mmetsp:Transcript_62542/g.139652  ORF Transcript_62542/g.139652 Transcript_62542/m.139652 type:complete len:230 (+) Transcript_62542:199-888(+)
MLHIDFASLLSGEGGVHAQHTLLDIAFELFPVQVFYGIACAKKEHAGTDLLTLAVLHDPLLCHRSPWRQPGAHACHKDRPCRLLWQDDGALPHGAHDLRTGLLHLHVACALSKSKLLGALHCPVYKDDAELDLVRMHQRRAGDGIAPGFQHGNHLQQLLNRWASAGELFEDVCMVRKVMHQVPVQGRALRGVLNNALQLLFLSLILGKVRQGLKEFAVGLAEDVKDMRE